MKCKRLDNDAFLFKTATAEYLVEVCSDITWFYVKIHHQKKWLFWFTYWEEVYSTIKMPVPKLPEDVIAWIKGIINNYEKTLPEYQWFEV